MSGAEDVAREFVRRINAHDVDALCALMTEDHAFVDALDNRMVGRETMRAGWQGYFTMVPDYWITIESGSAKDDTAALFGRAGGTYASAPEGTGGWEIPGAWRAVVRDGRVALWQVYADNLPIRKLMGAEK